MSPKPARPPREPQVVYQWSEVGTPPSVLWEHAARPLWAQAAPSMGAVLIHEKERVELRDAVTGAPRWEQAARELPDEMRVDARGITLAAGRDLQELRPENGAARWRYHSGGKVTGLAADPDTLYVSTKGPLLALDRAGGKPRWKVPTAWEPDLRPVPERGLLLVDNPETETVEAYRSASGERAWEFAAGGQPVAVGEVIGDVAPVSCHAAGLAGLDLARGAIRWKVESPHVFENPAVALGDRLYATAGSLFAVDPRSGAVTWELKPAPEDDLFFTVRAAGDLLLAETWRGRLLALRPEDGSLVWERRLGQVHGLAFDAQRFYLRYHDAEANRWTAAAFDRATGEPAWALHAERMVADLTVIDRVLIAEVRNRVLALALG